MKHLTTLLLLLPSLMTLSCQSESIETSLSEAAKNISSAKKITSTRSIKLPIGPEINDWENAVTQKTKKISASRNLGLEDVKEVVSNETHELELAARDAFIDIQNQISALSMDALKQLGDPEKVKLTLEHEEEIKEINKEIAGKMFTDKKNRLIEKHYYETLASQ